jgi:hypothetical protein
MVGIPAAIMSLCSVFDMRLQKAVLAMNAERRLEARRRGWLSRLTGWGLPVGDRVLFAVSLALWVVLMAAGFSRHGPAVALGIAGFFLVCVAQIALMARGYPTDRFVGLFS